MANGKFVPFGSKMTRIPAKAGTGSKFAVSA